jgi:hypothetical protein
MVSDEREKIQRIIEKREAAVREKRLAQAITCLELLAVVNLLGEKQFEEAEIVLSRIVVEIIGELVDTDLGDGYKLGLGVIHRMERMKNKELKIFALMQEKIKDLEAKLAERQRQREERGAGSLSK